MINKNLIIFFSLLIISFSFAQSAENYGSGLKIDLDSTKEKYIKFQLSGQFWTQYNENQKDGSIDFSIRRARIITYAQLNPDFLIFMQFGTNSLNEANLSTDGRSTSSAFFLHDMWAEYKINNKIFVGGGIHSWNGISRENNSGTTNLLTLDNDRSSWSSIGLSDQNSRHIGVYAKGQLGKINYQFAINDALKDTYQTKNYDESFKNQKEGIFYNGKNTFGSKADLVYAGYADYNLGEQENNKLPFKAGSYLGYKKILNIGAGFFHQPNAVVEIKKNTTNNSLDLISHNATHLGLDVFYDKPIGNKNAALNLYAKYQFSDLGKNYTYSDLTGTGNSFYVHAGYLIPNDTKTMKNRFLPYVSYSYRDFEGLQESAKSLKTGVNWYLNGNNSKLTLEWNKELHKSALFDDIITLQAQISL